MIGKHTCHAVGLLYGDWQKGPLRSDRGVIVFVARRS